MIAILGSGAVTMRRAVAAEVHGAQDDAKTEDKSKKEKAMMDHVRKAGEQEERQGPCESLSLRRMSVASDKRSIGKLL